MAGKHRKVVVRKRHVSVVLATSAAALGIVVAGVAPAGATVSEPGSSDMAAVDQEQASNFGDAPPAPDDGGLKNDQAGPMQEVPADPAPVQEAPVQQEPVQQAPVQQDPVQEAPVQQDPVQQEPVQQDPVDEAPPADDQPTDHPSDDNSSSYDGSVADRPDGGGVFSGQLPDTSTSSGGDGTFQGGTTQDTEPSTEPSTGADTTTAPDTTPDTTPGTTATDGGWVLKTLPGVIGDATKAFSDLVFRTGPNGEGKPEFKTMDFPTVPGGLTESDLVGGAYKVKPDGKPAVSQRWGTTLYYPGTPFGIGSLPTYDVGVNQGPGTIKLHPPVTGPWSGNVLSDGKISIPGAVQEGEYVNGRWTSGSRSVKSIDITPGKQVQLRVVGLKPVGTDIMQTEDGKLVTAVHYEYQYEMRTTYTAAVNGTPTIAVFPTEKDWHPVSNADVQKLTTDHSTVKPPEPK